MAVAHHFRLNKACTSQGLQVTWLETIQECREVRNELPVYIEYLHPILARSPGALHVGNGGEATLTLVNAPRKLKFVLDLSRPTSRYLAIAEKKCSREDSMTVGLRHTIMEKPLNAVAFSSDEPTSSIAVSHDSQY